MLVGAAAVAASQAGQAAGLCAAVVQGPREVGVHRALAATEGSALDEMAPWGPLPAVEASRGPAGPSLGAEAGAFLRAPLLSIWKMKRHTQLKTSGLTAPP